jgi:hypothetical protein
MGLHTSAPMTNRRPNQSFDKNDYHKAGMTDLSKMREQAERALADTRSPGETRVHIHEHKDPCRGNTHEDFTFVFGREVWVA